MQVTDCPTCASQRQVQLDEYAVLNAANAGRHLPGPVPMSCPKCRAEGSFYGVLVHPEQEVPSCPYHKGTKLEKR